MGPVGAILKNSKLKVKATAKGDKLTLTYGPNTVIVRADSRIAVTGRTEKYNGGTSSSWNIHQLQVREDGLFRLIVCVQDLVLTTSCQMERFIFQERHRVVQIIRQAALPQQQPQRNRVRQAAKIRLRLSLMQDTVDQILVRQGMEWQRRT